MSETTSEPQAEVDKRWAIMEGYPGTDWLADVEGMSNQQVEFEYRRQKRVGRI